MPRKGRRELVGGSEDDERREREESYSELETELHGAWPSGDPVAELMVDPDDQITEADK